MCQIKNQLDNKLSSSKLSLVAYLHSVQRKHWVSSALTCPQGSAGGQAGEPPCRVDGQKVPRRPHQRVLNSHGHPHRERGQGHGLQHDAAAATREEGDRHTGAQRHCQPGKGQRKIIINTHGNGGMAALSCTGHQKSSKVCCWYLGINRFMFILFGSLITLKYGLISLFGIPEKYECILNYSENLLKPYCFCCMCGSFNQLLLFFCFVFKISFHIVSADTNRYLCSAHSHVFGSRSSLFPLSFEKQKSSKTVILCLFFISSIVSIFDAYKKHLNALNLCLFFNLITI